MPRYQIIRDEIYLIGTGWNGGEIASVLTVPRYDMTSLVTRGLTRENVQTYINGHSGDFQWVTDWSANFGSCALVGFPWDQPDSENLYFDCVYRTNYVVDQW